MSRFLYIVCLTLFGFILIPTNSYACGTSREKSERTCTKDKLANSDIQDCCKQADSSHSEKGCDGICSNAGCHCPSVFSNVTNPLFTKLVQVKFIETTTNLYYQETYYSSGFLSIWQPPKIG
ncbi:hypothetical protein [Confluentibacter flavum]|uniref:Uncharacterized protein n=1 Tax=Confluentibacter flavum TaxID=1909700 RepID=A0A2N3HMH2_9FLAO|nr:hypothetical protein [Confluentibacter flavum]PKQ46141.1 hypothetical protein CSW08_02925 [Confluentibacter flavum]